MPTMDRRPVIPIACTDFGEDLAIVEAPSALPFCQHSPGNTLMNPLSCKLIQFHGSLRAVQDLVVLVSLTRRAARVRLHEYSSLLLSPFHSSTYYS